MTFPSETSTQARCGACHTPFATPQAVREHTLTCPAAQALLWPVTRLALGGKDYGHRIAHLARAAAHYSEHITEYARAISTEMPSLERSAIHQRLCQRLGLEYGEFRPFESEDITEIPSQEEAEAILWRAIAAQLQEWALKAEAEAEAANTKQEHAA